MISVLYIQYGIGIAHCIPLVAAHPTPAKVTLQTAAAHPTSGKVTLQTGAAHPTSAKVTLRTGAAHPTSGREPLMSKEVMRESLMRSQYRRRADLRWWGCHLIAIGAK